MSYCPQCHHRPSGRVADHGAECQCKCHDVADAAPDLLAALKEMLPHARCHIRDLTEQMVGSLYPAINAAALDRAAAAIAKAEGQS